HVHPAVGLEDASQPATSSSRKADSPNQPVTPTLPLVPSPDGRTSENYSTLTLNQAVYASLNGHPTIAAGLEAIRQAEGDFITSTLAPNPTFFTDIQMLPFKGAFKPTRQGGPPQQDAFVTYPIDWFLFGKRAAA